MRFVFASSDDAAARRYHAALIDLPGVTFLAGSLPDVAGECDEILMKFYLAHDRYGRTPEIGRSQVPRNKRNDGLPAIIVTKPPFSLSERITEAVELARRLQWMFTIPMRVLDEFLANSSDTVTLLPHREGLGDFAENQVVDALRRSIQAHVNRI